MSRISQAVSAALLLACGSVAPLLAQPPATQPIPAQDTEQLAEVTVTAARLSLIGHSTTASQGVVTRTEIDLAPAFRPAQVLETVPGLDVTTHSGEGKANQYLMRGYNLDHGTDLALFVDGMPINEPTHAHGDGYADINFLLPELATNVTYTKGTYYVAEGDFASVGSIHINYLNTLPAQVSVGVGTLDFHRYFAAGSSSIRDANLLGAFEFQHYDGPSTLPGDQQKYNGVLRFSTGGPDKGYSITAMDYHDTWNSQTDVPYEALYDAELASRWDQMDKTDGGYAHRVSLSWQYHHHLGDGQFLANAYTIGNHLTLWNNFTHYLVDPIHGDQEAQHEDRTTLGGDTSYGWSSQMGGFTNDWLVGAHTREDYNHVLRMPTEGRVPLTTEQLAAAHYSPFFSENDDVRLTELAGYVQATTHWTDALRSVLGFREDYMYGTDTGTWPGSASRALAEPKASLIYRLSPDTEVYASYGTGFHSDDLRGVNQAKIQHESGAPLLASQTGEELGLRQDLLAHKMAITVALFSLYAQSETTYDPDVGQDSAGPASIRRGYEVNLTYQITDWPELYGSYSGDQARYTSDYDDGSGHDGRYLPNSPLDTGDFSIYLTNLGRWSGSLEYRLLGRYPVTSGPCTDNAVAAAFGQGFTCADAPITNGTGTVWAAGYGELNGDVHYTFPRGWNVGLGIYNLLNAHQNSMTYYYVYRLAGQPDYGQAGETFHPLEPISVRLTIGRTF